MGRAVLMIAFHFPPAAMGSGHLRTLGFARHLPEFGWDPIVLSARPLAYPRTAPIRAGVIPENCVVHRAMALDASRHLGIRGKYPGLLAQPDRWVSWWPAAVAQGLRLIRRHQVCAIWSTYPIMTAHCIARTLSQVAKVPWVADFRDPVTSSVEAENPFSVASQRRWEQRVLRDAKRTVFTTSGALHHYAERYPEAGCGGRLSVIGNGYDEAEFVDLPRVAPPLDGRPLMLLHSGLLYPEGRDPVPFFKALARLKASGLAAPALLKVVLRASGWETRYQQEIDSLGIADIVSLAPPVGNREALVEQAVADGLLLFQGSKFDRQIPAKVYEYLRIARPIFALVGPDGDTASVLRDTGGAAIAPSGDVAAIAQHLSDFVFALREGRAPRTHPEVVARYSRREGAASLAGLLDQVCA
jgi:glycosyltransferase involved in cell wall biosynthesis